MSQGNEQDAPKPSPQLLQRLGLSAEQWSALPVEEKKTRLMNLLKAVKGESPKKLPSQNVPPPPRSATSEARFIINYHSDDTTVQDDEPTPVHLKSPVKASEIQSTGRLYGRVSQRQSDTLGFDVADEDSDSDDEN